MKLEAANDKFEVLELLLNDTISEKECLEAELDRQEQKAGEELEGKVKEYWELKLENDELKARADEISEW